MVRVELVPSRFSIWLRKLGCVKALRRSCVTGWLEVEEGLNSEIRFRGSAAETTRVGRYPNRAGSVSLPALVPWQRRQFSNWLMAGLRTVIPSAALTPAAPFCEGRIAGGAPSAAARMLWWGFGQSTPVAWRVFLS